jgi:hypothetical protein
MVLIAVFYMGVYLAVLGLTWLILTGLTRSLRRTWPMLLKMVGAAVMALPVVWYNAYVFTTNPLLKIWGQQNIILSPEPWHYGLAYGLLALPALYGGWLMGSRSFSGAYLAADWVKSLVLISWCLVFPLLVYLPFNLQRRLVVGVQVPLAILATYGLFELTRKYVRADIQQLTRAGILVLLALTNIFLLFGSTVTLTARTPPIFLPSSQVTAMGWLASRAYGEVVLAVYETSNALPAYAYVRAFTGHGPETIHSDERRAQAQTFFKAATPDTWRRELLQQFNISYVYYGPNEQASGDFAPESTGYLRKVYRNSEVIIFRVDPEALD